MKKISNIFFVLTIVLYSFSGIAQDKLIRIDSASVSWRQNDLPSSFYDKELARLLLPPYTQFGVVRRPSLGCESSLTYDSVNHTLVYVEAYKSIYDATNKATTTYRPLSARKWAHKTHPRDPEKKNDNNMVRVIPRKRPYKYISPKVRTLTFPITDEQALALKEKWTEAIQNAEDGEVSILDGTTWIFFIGNQRAQSHEPQNPFVKFANELMDSIYNVDWGRKDPDDYYCDTIKWKSKDSLKHVVCVDTCRLKQFEVGVHYLASAYTQRLQANDISLFCRYLPVGSGLPIWKVQIYKQETDQWCLVAEGEVTRPTFSFKADYDSNHNRIVFSTLYAKYSSLTHEPIAFARIDEVGILCLDDL